MSHFWLPLYAQLGRYAFSCTVIANLIFSKCSDEMVRKNAYTFTSVLLLKGLIYGVLWPTVLFQPHYNPEEYFILGKGPEKYLIRGRTRHPEER